MLAKTEKAASVAPKECTLNVRYCGDNTFREIAGDFENGLPADLNSIRCNCTENQRVRVHCKIDLTPVSRNFNLIFKDTRTVIEIIQRENARGLNIPETLEMGDRFPAGSFVALGQPLVVERPYGMHKVVLVVVRRGILLLPYNWAWGGHYEIPITWDPDPLVSA
jgi:hypothetical protein